MRTVSIPLRWGDLDAYGHVNNVEVLRILEEARVRALWKATPESAGILPPLDRDEPVWAVVSAMEVRYLRPISYSDDPVAVDIAVSAVAAAAFVLDYRLRVGAADEPSVTATTTVVMIDRETGAPRRIPSDIRHPLVAARSEPDLSGGRRGR